jgi:trehalose 6-phosphate synthase
MANRLVIVRNRLPVRSGVDTVASADAFALDAAPNSLWFGWSGRVCDALERPVAVGHCGTATLVAMDLNVTQYEGYLNGFSNGTLWPLLHGAAARIQFNPDDLAVYRAVNARFASQLIPLLQPDDHIWVQDYHLFPLGWMLRQAGVQSPIGFSLHTPFPDADHLMTVPWRRKLAADLSAYDLVSFETRRDQENFDAFMRQSRLGLSARTAAPRTEGMPAHVALPSGPDTRAFMDFAASMEITQRATRLARSLGNRRIIVGVDRLDYINGLLERFHGFERLLETAPELRTETSLVQVTAPSRTLVPGYLELRMEQADLARRINGRFTVPGWMPILDIYARLPRASLAALYRISRVGLAIPQRDGPTINAKEFVAAQDSGDPGVLILSREAGAAELLNDAILVDPDDPDSIAKGLRAALAMPLDERQDLWRRMSIKVMHNDVTQWHHAFAYRLSRARHTTPASGEEGAPGEEMLTPAFLPVTRTKPAEFRSR